MTQISVVVKLDYNVSDWALGLAQRCFPALPYGPDGEARGFEDGHNQVLAIPAKTKCPFCGKEAVAVPSEQGTWYTIAGCDHCNGIYAGGRMDEGAFHFEGSLPRGIGWTSEDYEIDSNGLLHGVNVLNGMKKGGN